MRRDVFQAIADPVRRDIIELLAKETLSINSIANQFEISRPEKLWEGKLDSFEKYLTKLQSKTNLNE